MNPKNTNPFGVTVKALVFNVFYFNFEPKLYILKS